MLHFTTISSELFKKIKTQKNMDYYKVTNLDLIGCKSINPIYFWNFFNQFALLELRVFVHYGYLTPRFACIHGLAFIFTLINGSLLLNLNKNKLLILDLKKNRVVVETWLWCLLKSREAKT